MFPQEIARILQDHGLGWEPSDNLNACIPRPAKPPHVIEDWILRHEGDYPEISAYLDFLRSCRRHFDHVLNSMGYWNQEANHGLGHDKWSVGWAGKGLLPIANHLYCLKSYGLSGNLLECGVFKGSSTACLSFACKLIGSHLFSADSFEGLPCGEFHYSKGDFIGRLDEVKENMRRFGESDVTTFIPGWYSESLKGFDSPISMIWVDVDLSSSTLDVLNHVFGALEPSAAIFSDGFSVGVDYDGKRIRVVGCEPAGFDTYFRENQLDYQAIPAGPPGLALIVPGINEDLSLLFNAENFQYLIAAL